MNRYGVPAVFRSRDRWLRKTADEPRTNWFGIIGVAICVIGFVILVWWPWR